MKPLESAERAAEVLRAQICPSCPYRKPGPPKVAAGSTQPCERECPLFANLAFLAGAVQQLDPMIGDRRKRITHLLKTIARIPVGKNKEHYRFGRRTVDVLDNAFPK